MGAFIRLVDYMVLETQVKINQESTERILTEMRKTEKKYGILTEVNFDDEGIFLTNHEFLQKFEQLEADMLQATDEISSVAGQQAFNQFTQGVISEKAFQFRDLVDNSPEYQNVRNDIATQIKGDLEKLQTAVDKFEAC